MKARTKGNETVSSGSGARRVACGACSVYNVKCETRSFGRRRRRRVRNEECDGAKSCF